MKAATPCSEMLDVHLADRQKKQIKIRREANFRGVEFVKNVVRSKKLIQLNDMC